MNIYELKVDDLDNGEHLAHHGILGQRWGVRRYQNEDGTLTDLGKKRYKKKLEKKLWESEYRDSNADFYTDGKNYLVDPKNHKNYRRLVSELKKKEPMIRPDDGETKDIGWIFGPDVSEKYKERILGARLKDLGLDDIEYGRELLDELLGDDYDTEIGYH